MVNECWLYARNHVQHHTLTDSGSCPQERSDRALHVPPMRGERLARFGRAELRDRFQQEGDARLLVPPNPSTFTTTSTAAAAATARAFATAPTFAPASDAANSTAAAAATAEAEAQLQVDRHAIGECGALQVEVPPAVPKAQLQPLQATDELQRKRLRDGDGRRVARG